MKILTLFFLTFASLLYAQAPMILANIQKLGFRPNDVKMLLNSQAHFDHAGGLAQLKHVTGARMIARAVVRASRPHMPTESRRTSMPAKFRRSSCPAKCQTVHFMRGR